MAPTFSKTVRLRLAHGALLVAAFLFGVTFVVVKNALEEIPPFAFLAWRFSLACLFLLFFVRPRGRAIWRDGVVAGLVLFAGYAFQTVGLTETTASNSALITGLYVVLTPFLAALAFKRRVHLRVVAGAALAFFGLVLLSLPEQASSLSLSRGDLLSLGCAIAFALHVVVLSRLAPRHAVLPFTLVQLVVVALLSTLVSVPSEGLPLPGVVALVAIVVTALGATAGAFVLQIWAQRVVGPSRTALVLAAEPVFAAVFAAWFLGERLSSRGLVGAAMILLGVAFVLKFTNAEEY